MNTVSFANSLDDLVSTTEWRSLLHINENNQSEISDMNFFLSRQTDPKIEMQTLLEKKSCETICKYPARYRYLSKAMDLNISFDHCNELKYFLKEMNGDSASLIFASSFLDSPASYFGHTFINISKPNNVYFSNTIGYAAELNKITNPLNIIVDGISGNYNGKYVVSPYYQMVEMYNVVEQRALYEYKLDLNKNEIDNMVWHFYELKDLNIPYEFFTENCAYQVFWLIEVARPSLNLRNKLKTYVIPYETIQVVKNAKMVEGYQKRAPLVDNLYQVHASLSSKEKEVFSKWKESEHKENNLAELEISDSTRMKYAELINGYYDVLFKKYHTSKADYYDVKKIGYKKSYFLEGSDFEPKKPHQLSLGMIEKNDKKGEYINFRPVLMDRYEERDSVLSESTLEFLNIAFSRIENNTKLENFDLLKVESLNKRFDFYEPSSWRVYMGVNRSYTTAEITPVVEFGKGITVGNELVSGYALAQVALYPHRGSLNMQLLSGISMWIDHVHLNFDYKKSLADTNGASLTQKTITVYYPLKSRYGVRLINDYAINEQKIYLDVKF